eukprot:1464884-Rhodomonas_salina.4
MDGDCVGPSSVSQGTQLGEACLGAKGDCTVTSRVIQDRMGLRIGAAHRPRFEAHTKKQDTNKRTRK